MEVLVSKGLYRVGDLLVNVHNPSLHYIVVKDQGEGMIRVIYRGQEIRVFWDNVRKMSKLEKALK